MTGSNTRMALVVVRQSPKNYVVEKPETLLKCALGIDKNGFPKKLAEQITLYL